MNMGLLRHGAMPVLFGVIRAPSTLGSFPRSFTWGNVLQRGKVHRELLAELARRAPRCCPARTSWPSSLSTRSRSVPTGTPIRERRSGSPRSGASPAGAGAERAGRRPGLPGSPPGRRVLPGHRPDGSQRPRRRRAGRAVPAWCHHAVFTDSPFTLLQAEEQHRGHARAEQVFADWTDGPLAHPALRLVPRQRRLAGTGRHQRQPAACRRIPGQPHIRLGQGRHRAPRPHRRRGPPSASRPVPQPADEKRSPEFTRWIQA